MQNVVCQLSTVHTSGFQFLNVFIIATNYSVIKKYNDTNLDMTKEETNEKPECNWFVLLATDWRAHHKGSFGTAINLEKKKVISKKAISIVEDDVRAACVCDSLNTELNGVNYMFNVWTSKGTCVVHKIWIKFRFIIRCTCENIVSRNIACYCYEYVCSMRYWIDRKTILWMGTGHNALHYYYSYNEWMSFIIIINFFLFFFFNSFTHFGYSIEPNTFFRLWPIV